MRAAASVSDMDILVVMVLVLAALSIAALAGYGTYRLVRGGGDDAR